MKASLVSCVLLGLALFGSVCDARDTTSRRMMSRLIGKGGKAGGLFHRNRSKGYRNKSRRNYGCGEEGDTEHFYFVEHLVHGEMVTLLENGPLRVMATCHECGVALELTLEWPESDLFVYGDLSGDQSLNDTPLVNQVLHAGIKLEKKMWQIGTDREGNDTGDGAVKLSTGHLVKWGGDLTIGIHRSNKTDLALPGNEYNCIVTGIMHYLIPEEFQE